MYFDNIRFSFIWHRNLLLLQVLLMYTINSIVADAVASIGSRQSLGTRLITYLYKQDFSAQFCRLVLMKSFFFYQMISFQEVDDTPEYIMSL